MAVIYDIFEKVINNTLIGNRIYDTDKSFFRYGKFIFNIIFFKNM